MTGLQNGSKEGDDGLATFPSCNPAILPSCNLMNVLIGVISPAAIWVIPRSFVDQLRRDFPQHTFLEAWDRLANNPLLDEFDRAVAETRRQMFEDSKTGHVKRLEAKVADLEARPAGAAA